MEPLLYSEPSKLSNSNSFVFLTPRRKIKLFRVCDQLQAALKDTQIKICYQVSKPITSPSQPKLSALSHCIIKGFTAALVFRQ